MVFAKVNVSGDIYENGTISGIDSDNDNATHGIPISKMMESSSSSSSSSSEEESDPSSFSYYATTAGSENGAINANSDEFDDSMYHVDAYISPPLLSQMRIMTIGIGLYVFFLLFFTLFDSFIPSSSTFIQSSSSSITMTWSSSILPSLPISSSLLQPSLLLSPFIVYLFILYKISIFCVYCFKINDNACTRRQLITQYENNHPVATNIVLNISKEVSYKESYWINSRGMVLQTAKITRKSKSNTTNLTSATTTATTTNISATTTTPNTPANTEPPKAIICYCHGYTDNPCYSKRKVLSSLVENTNIDITVLIITYEGHGKSDGTLGLINNFDTIIKDASDYFQQQLLSSRCSNVFLMGESMGGAVAFQVYQQLPHLCKGVIFISPMCKISNNMLPPQWIINLGTILAGKTPHDYGNNKGDDGNNDNNINGTGTCSRLGYFPISPARGDLKKLSYRIAEKRKYIASVPSAFGNRNPRLATARELLRITRSISQNLSTFDAPFLIHHGKEDKVTDPKLSQALYDESCSKDKTIRLHDGMWHQILNGEPDENTELVMTETILWMLARCHDSEKKKL